MLADDLRVMMTLSYVERLRPENTPLENIHHPEIEPDILESAPCRFGQSKHEIIMYTGDITSSNRIRRAQIFTLPPPQAAP
jgi:hypothetical protein